MMTLQQACDEHMAHMIVDGSRGIYLPQAFAETFGDWPTISPILRAVLLQGPYGDAYWQVWDTVLIGATYVDLDGHVWELVSSDDLWAVRQDTNLDYGAL